MFRISTAPTIDSKTNTVLAFRAVSKFAAVERSEGLTRFTEGDSTLQTVPGDLRATALLTIARGHFEKAPFAPVSQQLSITSEAACRPRLDVRDRSK